MFIAKVFRRAYPREKIASLDLWFQLHRGFMLLAVFLSIIGVIVIFTTRGGWSSSAGSHAIVGIITFSLGLLNPIMAVFRPPADSGKFIKIYVISMSLRLGLDS